MTKEEIITFWKLKTAICSGQVKEGSQESIAYNMLENAVVDDIRQQIAAKGEGSSMTPNDALAIIADGLNERLQALLCLVHDNKMKEEDLKSIASTYQEAIQILKKKITVSN